MTALKGINEYELLTEFLCLPLALLDTLNQGESGTFWGGLAVTGVSVGEKRVNRSMRTRNFPPGPFILL